MDFAGLIAALEHHQAWEGEAVQVRDENGVWWDVIDIVRPLAEGWDQVGNAANTDALDGDQVAKLDPNAYIVGRSDMAHRVLQIMASAEQKAVEQ